MNDISDNQPNKTMRILIFSTVFYPLLGGIENLTLNLVQEFIKKGHQVKVIAAQNEKDNLPDVEVYYKPSYSKMFNLFSWCNVYYMPNISLRGMWPMAVSPRKKWVISLNDFSLTNHINPLSLLKLAAIRFTSANISVSKSVADSLHTKSKVVYNCYDDSIFKITNTGARRGQFVFVGRLVTQKGCDILLNACARLNHNFHLTIIGEGPERENLQELCITLGIDKQVSFLGKKTSVEIAHILNEHQTLVVPSVRKEGFGIVVLEGLACGCRIIAADSGGLSEAVGSFGKLFEPGNITQLTGLMREFSGEKEPGINSDLLNEYLNSLTVKAVAQEYLEVFQD